MEQLSGANISTDNSLVKLFAARISFLAKHHGHLKVVREEMDETLIIADKVFHLNPMIGRICGFIWLKRGLQSILEEDVCDSVPYKDSIRYAMGQIDARLQGDRTPAAR